MDGLTGGLLATLWLAGLWYAAPVLQRGSNDLCDRIRNAMLLGVAIPMTLGLLGLLYPWACLAMLAACAWWRFRSVQPAMVVPDHVTLTLLSLLLVFVWPYLCEPLLDGDTLLYHLPNAATWAQTHSVWQTTTHEWFYPPASEVFATPFFAFGARFSLPVCGAIAALLLVARIMAWGTAFGVSRFVSGICAFALLATPIVAFETGTLQNDLWLGAFFVEALYFAQTKTDWKSLAACALIKPSGVLFAAIAMLSARRFQPTALLALVPLSVWVLRDLLLAGHSTVPAQAIAGGYWASTIAANSAQVSNALLTGLRLAGFQCLLFLGLPIVGLFLPRLRRAAAAGCAALVAFAFLPMGFGAGETAFLASGTSLRFGIPAMVVGAIILVYLGSKARMAITSIAGAIALAGLSEFLWTFRSDGVALNGLWIAPFFAAIVYADRTKFRIASKLTLMLVLVASSWLASQRAAAFYADWMRAADGTPTAAFAWIASHRPEKIAALNFRTGAILMASPHTRVLDVDDGDLCKEARDARAALFVGTDRDLSASEQQRRFTLARSCGPVIFQDKAALIVNVR